MKHIHNESHFQFIEDDKNRTLAIFLPGHTPFEKTRFFTPNEEPFQCGIGVFKKGMVVDPHRHQGKPTPISEFAEFILIRKGKALAKVYDEFGNVFRTLEMFPGDSLLLFRGGHSFEFLEDTELLEIKQGPYQGRDAMKVSLKKNFSEEVAPIPSQPAEHLPNLNS